VKLVEPTDAQKRDRDRLTHAEWGKKLSVDEYLEREARLRAHKWARRDMRTWFLMEGQAVLASCETFRMLSLIDGQYRGSSYGFASVFTEPALRGKGHATTLMNQVCETLQAQDTQLHALFLFSDVGEKLYARAGFEARPGMDRSLPPLNDGVRPDEIIPITEHTLANELSSTPAPEQRFLIWPTPDQLDWHLERERIYAEKLGRTRPKWIGARIGHSTIFWCVYYASDVLSVLLLNAYSADDARMLLREAQRAAATAGVRRVELWESAAIGPWEEALAGVTPTAREGYLPMIRIPADDERTLLPTDWSVLPRALWI
jgi:GNAT superfamily N-acetyltransferase